MLEGGLLRGREHRRESRSRDSALTWVASWERLPLAMGMPICWPPSCATVPVPIATDLRGSVSSVRTRTDLGNLMMFRGTMLPASVSCVLANSPGDRGNRPGRDARRRYPLPAEPRSIG
jgi:hypothetical protein